MATSPAETEKLFLFLAGGDPEELLFDVRAAKSTALLQYARQWLTMVAKEFMAELQSALVCGPRGKPRAPTGLVGARAESAFRCARIAGSQVSMR